MKRIPVAILVAAFTIGCATELNTPRRPTTPTTTDEITTAFCEPPIYEETPCLP